MRTIMKKIDTAFTAVAALSLAAMTLLVVADVLLRYGNDTPIFFTHDLVTLYLTPTVFFFGVGPTWWRNEHLAVDLLVYRAPPKIKALSASIGSGIGLWIFALLAESSWQRAYQSLINNEVIASIIPWPAWASYLLVPAGSIAMVVFCAFRLIEQLGKAYKEPQ